ncbi:MAG: hypothetical protein N2594_02695, partial [Clostridiales bacterium]|nr:hypothetical protein [Clostridiales bacterium]
MAIVKMKKVTIVGAKEDKNNILKALQRASVIEIIDLKEKVEETIEGVVFENKSITENEINFNKIKQAYEFLKQFSTTKKGMFEKRDILDVENFENFAKTFNWMEMCSKAKDIEDGLANIKAKIAKTEALIQHYEIWSDLDISNAELNALKKVSYFIGTISKKYEMDLIGELDKFKDVYIEKISEKQQDLNIFVLCHKDDYDAVYEIIKKYGFTKLALELDNKPIVEINNLTEEINNLKKEQENLKLQAQELSTSMPNIEKVYDYFSSQIELERQNTKILQTKKAVVLEGWIPEDKTEYLTKIINAKNLQVMAEFKEPAEDEIPPVLLKNNALIEPFEAITEMYALPLPNEVDPTPVLAPFFLIFFGMMMADVGYGLLLGAVSLFLLFKADLDDSLKKMVKLLALTSIPTVIFGVLYGSFFGGIIKMKPLWVDPVADPMTILKYSIVFGIVHLYTGLGVKAYQLIKEGKV